MSCSVPFEADMRCHLESGVATHAVAEMTEFSCDSRHVSAQHVKLEVAIFRRTVLSLSESSV
jgi:hypothetical protein